MCPKSGNLTQKHRDNGRFVTFVAAVAVTAVITVVVVVVVTVIVLEQVDGI